MNAFQKKQQQKTKQKKHPIDLSVRIAHAYLQTITKPLVGSAVAQWYLVLDSRPKGRGFEPHCVVSLSKAHLGYPSIVLVQPRKTRPCITERLLMGRKESNQTNKNKSTLQF